MLSNLFFRMTLALANCVFRVTKAGCSQCGSVYLAGKCAVCRKRVCKDTRCAFSLRWGEVELAGELRAFLKNKGIEPEYDAYVCYTDMVKLRPEYRQRRYGHYKSVSRR